MSNLLDDIETYLVAQGLAGGSTGWTIYKGMAWPSPNKVVVIADTGGPAPELVRDGSSETELDEPRFQVMARGEAHDYSAVRDKIQAIYRTLHGSTPSTSFVFIRSLQSGPMSAGMDEESRCRLTWNFECFRNRSADT